MSRFVSKLQRLSKSTAPPIGFRPSDKTEKATMLLIAGLSAGGSEDGKLLNGAEVDAALVFGPVANAAQVKQMLDDMKNVPCGIVVVGKDQEKLDDVLACSCDFAVFGVQVPIAALHKEGMGKFLLVESSLDWGSVKAINSLDVDGVFMDGKGIGSSITIGDLLAYRKFIELLEKPVVVILPCLLGAAELNDLWQLGVDGIVVPPGQPAKVMTELRKLINGLPRRARSRSSKVVAALPGPTALMAEEENDEV